MTTTGTHPWLRRLRAVLLTVLVLLATGYALGGRGFLRVRARAAALLEPPTQSEMQRAVAAETAASRAAAQAPSPGYEPARPGEMLGVVAIALLGVLLLAVLTSRDGSAGRDRRARAEGDERRA